MWLSYTNVLYLMVFLTKNLIKIISNAFFSTLDNCFLTALTLPKLQIRFMNLAVDLSLYCQSRGNSSLYKFPKFDDLRFFTPFVLRTRAQTDFSHNLDKQFWYTKSGFKRLCRKITNVFFFFLSFLVFQWLQIRQSSKWYTGTMGWTTH